MSFGAQFLAGQKFAQGLIETYRDAQQRRELDEISKAQPVNADFLSDDASAKVQAAAADPTQHIGYDVGAKAYMATPKLGEDEMGPAQPKQIATAAPMTELLGNRTPGTMTPEQVSSAKFKAMADVVGKSDPIQGMRLQREVKQGERDDKRWEREDRKATEEEEFQKGYQAEYGQTNHAKNMGKYAAQVQAYEQYQAQLKGGADPATLGAPPPMPTRPVYSEAESLADSGRLLAFKASKGKADPAEILQYAERLQKVSDEGYGKALKLAQGGAPLEKVIEQFNQTGKVKLDPAAVVSDQMVPGADGVPARVIKVRDASGNVQTINALSELDAIGQAESYFNRFYKAEDNRRGNNADKRAETQLNETIRHNRASEGIAGANLRITQDEAARKKQVFEQQNKIPEPVRKSYEALETQAKALDSAMYKAMAEGTWQPGTPGAEKLIADRTAVSLRMNKLLDPYMPAAKQGASAPAADPLGLRTPPAAEKATLPAATPAAAPSAMRDTPMQSELAPRAATAPAQTARQPLTTLADVMGANSGDASLNSVLAPRVAAVQQAADAVKASQAAVANAAKSQNAQAVSAATAQSYEAQKALDALLSGWNPQQAAAIRKAVGL